MRIRVLSSVVVKCRVVGIRVLSLALLCWGWVSVPRARHREWLPLPWSECDDRAGRKTFNVPNSRDWVLSLTQRGYGFGPLAGTLQHLAIRLFVGHSLIARLNGPLQPKSGSDPLLPCAREVHTHSPTLGRHPYVVEGCKKKRKMPSTSRGTLEALALDGSYCIKQRLPRHSCQHSCTCSH